MKSVIISEKSKTDRFFKGDLVQLDQSKHSGSSKYVVLLTGTEKTDTGKFIGTIVYSAYPANHSLSVGDHGEFIASSFMPFDGVIQLESE